MSHVVCCAVRQWQATLQWWQMSQQWTRVRKKERERQRERESFWDMKNILLDSFGPLRQIKHSAVNCLPVYFYLFNVFFYRFYLFPWIRIALVLHAEHNSQESLWDNWYILPKHSIFLLYFLLSFLSFSKNLLSNGPTKSNSIISNKWSPDLNQSCA